MTTYKLFRLRDGRLYPLFVETRREMAMGQWLDAGIGELADPTHVRSRLGPLSLDDGTLLQRSDTVWCECRVEGKQVHPESRYGLRTIPDGWYYFRTKPKQPFPWIISDRIMIKRILTHEEVEDICRAHGVTAQRMEE